MLSRSIVSILVVHACGCSRVSSSDDEVGDSGSESESSESDGESESSESMDSSESDSTDTGPTPDDCEGIGTSNLEGVCIWFPSEGQSFSLAQAAQGITVPYHVIVEDDVAEVWPMAQDGGGCGQPDASGLIVFAILQGGEQRYCLCDVGLCPAPSDVYTLPAGDTPLAFEWSGHNWDGPSDTNNPLGPPFPAGAYTLEISAIGRVAGVEFSVSNSFALTLVE